MIDWFILLVPLAALPIVSMLVFVGCGWTGKAYPACVSRFRPGPV